MRRSAGFLATACVAVVACAAWTGIASAATGTLEICKSAANGANGATFKFSATNVANGNVKSLSVKGGACSSPMSAGTGKWTVQEDLSGGVWAVSAIAVVPSSDVVKNSADLADGLITVKVAAGVETQVTYTNAPASATLKVCKWSASTALQGATFTFKVAGTTVTAVAGDSAADAGCSNPVTVQPGSKLTVSETVPANEKVASIVAGGSAKLTSSTGGVANVTAGSGANILTYDNEPAGPPQTGYVEVCKDAYDQFVTGSYTFSISDTAGLSDLETVPVGQCTGPIKVAAGNVTIAERQGANTYVQSITAIPATALGPTNLTNGTAIAVVPVSSSTLNEVQVHVVNAAQMATLKVCKVLTSTSAALAGKSFTFAVSSSAGPNGSVGIVASTSANGACKNTLALPVGSTATVTEAGVPFVSADGGPVGGGETKTVTIQSGINTVTFTNQAYGTIEICKVMAASDQSYNGTVFNFSVNGGTAFPVRAGLGCSSPMTVPTGTATVNELLPDGSAFAFVSATATDPTGSTSRVVAPAGNPLTVTIPYPGGGGNETLVTFTNKVLRSNFKICKEIDPGSLTALGGMNFSFTWSASTGQSGTATVTPPYNGPADSCTALELSGSGIPVVDPSGNPTTITITENGLAGASFTVTSITVDNGTATNTLEPAGIVELNPGPGIVTVTYTNATNTNFEACGIPLFVYLLVTPPGTPEFAALEQIAIQDGCAAYVVDTTTLYLEFIRGPVPGFPVPIGLVTVGGQPLSPYNLALTASGTLYMTDGLTLYTLDTSTADATPIGAFGIVGPDYPLVVGPAPAGTLYGADNSTGNLLTINPVTGTGTSVGPIGFAPTGDLAFAHDGKLFMTGGTSGADDLINVNPTTGAGTLVGPVGITSTFGLISSYGTLFGFTLDGQLITIDEATGAGTVISSLGPPSTQGAASPPDKT